MITDQHYVRHANQLSHGSLNTHTSAAAKKSNSILGLIKKSFASLDKDILPLLFTSMVCPHLEYGNIIWGPHFIGDMKAVERVQKRATKMIPNLRNLSYRERLEILNLSSLYHRRRRGDMIMCQSFSVRSINELERIAFACN